MKKLLPLLLLISCSTPQEKQKQKEQSLKDNIKPVLITYTGAMLDTDVFSIDSLTIFKIDTLTPQKLEFFKATIYLNLINEDFGKINDLVEDGKPYKRMLDIQYDAWAANNLKDLKEKSDKLLSEMNMYGDLYKGIIGRISKTDSLTFLNYVARFRVKYSNKKTKVQTTLDSGEVIITPDLKVIDKKTLIEKEVSEYIQPELPDTSSNMLVDTSSMMMTDTTLSH